MSEIRVILQNTPNPNAKKFITNRDLLEDGKISFKDVNDCQHVPLATAIMNMGPVTQIHFFENVLTVTQGGESDWEALGEEIESCLKSLLPEHNPRFKTGEAVRRENLPPNVQSIEEILDTHIRPYLQGDGGDLEVLEFEEQHKILTIRYEGACGTCPSATTGTLHAIQSVLRDEFDEEIEVVSL